jgi:hypothetical protein
MMVSVCPRTANRRLIHVLVAVVSLGFVTAAAQTATPDPAQEAPCRVDEEGTMNLLFIHHSCGGALLASPGDLVGGSRATGERCIYESHPNGGGLRDLLQAAGYRVNQASYGSIIGEDTDICHWHAKFTTQMDRILRTRRQDALLPGDQTNQIVVFKSCYPNNWFTGRGQEPGDPDDCKRTVANARAAYRSLIPIFRQRPDALFVAFTAPPMAEFKPVGWRQRIKAWFRSEDRGGELAREFNTWLADREHGWLAGYEAPNIVVFDFYHILTGDGAGVYSAYATRDGLDSHPGRDGNRKAAEAFMTVLQGAVAGMGWVGP